MKLDKTTIVGGLEILLGLFLVYNGYKRAFQYMSMVLAEGAEEAGASTAASGAGESSSSGGFFGNSGLTGTQKATAASRAVPAARTQHPYLVGLILIIVGGFSLVGSLTGTLPAMLGALFDPNALMDRAGNSAGPRNPLAVINPLTNPLAISSPLSSTTTSNLKQWFVTDPSQWLITDPSNWLNNL